MRADHSYPNAHNTPQIEEIAKSSITYADHWSNGTTTTASHVALLTAQVPAHAGFRDLGDRLSTLVTTVPEVLGIYGYRRVMVLPSPADSPLGPEGCTWIPSSPDADHAPILATLHPKEGLAQGFEGTLTGNAASCVQTLVQGIAKSDMPVFALIHIKDAHIPYGLDQDRNAPAPLQDWARGASSGTGQVAHDAALLNAISADPSLIPTLHDAYASALSTADTQVGLLWRALQEAGLEEDAAIAIVGDHGEALGETGAIGHQGIFVPEVLQVPLVLHLPNDAAAGTRIDRTTSHADLAVTLLNLGGARVPYGADGHDLRDETTSLVVATGMGMSGGFRRPMAFLAQDGHGVQVAFAGSHAVHEQGWHRQDGAWRAVPTSATHLQVEWRRRASALGSQADRAPLTTAQKLQIRKDGYW